jgi:hypothetical protein
VAALRSADKHISLINISAACVTLVRCVLHTSAVIRRSAIGRGAHDGWNKALCVIILYFRRQFPFRHKALRARANK